MRRNQPTRHGTAGASRPGARWWSRVAGAVLVTRISLQAATPLAVSANYTLYPAAPAAGGGVAASTDYRLVSSIGAPGSFAAFGASLRLGHGFAAALNEPPQPRHDTLSRTPGRTAKIHLTRLRLNDTDPDDDALHLLRFDARSERGGRVGLDNDWLLYEPPPGGAASDTFTYTLRDAAGHTATATVFVLEAAPGLAPSQNLIALTLLPGGQRRLTFAGIAGRRYVIEWSDTLPATRWEPLAIVEADPQGFIEWVDATEPPPATRFYRTVSP